MARRKTAAAGSTRRRPVEREMRVSPDLGGEDWWVRSPDGELLLDHEGNPIPDATKHPDWS